MSSALDRGPLAIFAAGPQHAQELARLHQSLFATAWDDAGFGRLLRHAHAAGYLARAGEPAETLGFILGQVVADEAEILSLGVRTDVQRRGIATHLFEAMIAAGRLAQARRIYLEVAAENSAAIAFYARLGFARSGRRVAYYQRAGGGGEDALVMCRPL